jgi:phytanoyl-CoA hydroxylase
MLNFLRRYKITIHFYNFFKKKQLTYNLALYKRLGLLKKKYYSSVSSEDFNGLESPKNYLDASESSIELPKQTAFKNLNSSIQDSLLSWSKDGYVILNNFFDDNEIKICNSEISRLIDCKEVKFRYANKIMDAFLKSEPLYKLASNSKLNDILQLLMGKEIGVFQSINFLKGSQQRSHSDSIHMTTFPYGNIIAVWIALEDVTEESGPLHYYPGSHKLPYLMNRQFDNIGSSFKLGDKLYTSYEDKVEEVLQSQSFEKKVFLAKKGDVLIWHANLIHGGEPHINPKLSRKSMVFHFYSWDAVCFHEISQRPALKPILKFN